MPNYYEILGIQKTANNVEITKAYKKLTLLYHPDKKPEPEKKAAEEKFIQIKAAYETLIDPLKRTT